MAIVKSVVLHWPQSPSPDVQYYHLYMQEQPTAVGYQSEKWNVGKNIDENDKAFIDLSTLDNMTTKDGTYNIGITAVDSAGNESSMAIKEGVVLDFEAPDPPGAITVERS